MAEQKSLRERLGLLIKVAEMYYLEGKNQDEIAQVVGVTRSMVSRMLTEARARGIVEIRIHRPLEFDHTIETLLQEEFGLENVCVVDLGGVNDDHLLKYLGVAGSTLLEEYLKSESILGAAWGSSVSAVVDQVEKQQSMPIKIVQLVGALGATMNEYNGHSIVQRLVQKVGGEGYYLNAPFICPTPETAHSLKETPGVKEAIEMGQKCTLALLGVGSTLPQYSSFYLAGYVPVEELDDLRQIGAVGDVCGLHFDIHGNEICGQFCERLVTIRKEHLLAIPVRIGVAGGLGKVDAILGALRGGYINVLATDNITARKILEEQKVYPINNRKKEK